MRAYSTREVAELLGIPRGRVLSLVRAGFVSPQRTSRGHYRFSFQDIVLLRTAQELLHAGVGTRRVWRALKALIEQLPSGRPLSSVRVVVEADRVLVREHNMAWEAETRQRVLDFSVQELARKVAPLVRASALEASRKASSAEEWFDLGLELDQIGAHEDAQAAYRKVLAARPHHIDARINLGRILHAQRAFKEAETLYRQAIELDPAQPTARFNLGVVLEDQNQIDAAVEQYKLAAEIDPNLADAHYNLARLYEHQGDQRAALRHFTRFKALIRPHD